MENKRITFEDVVLMGKKYLEKNWGLNPQAILEDKKGAISMVLLPITSEKDKENGIKSLRKIVFDNNIDKYYISMVSWCTPIKGKDREKKEALVVIEFIKGDNGKYGTYTFKRTGKKIVFDENPTIDSTKNLVTLWNVFYEEEGVKEHLANTFKKMKSKSIYRGRQ